MERSKIAKLINDYMDALRDGDYSLVRFSPNVRFLGPLMNSPIEGKSKVVEFLADVSKGVKDIRVRQHIIEGETVCVLIEFETVKGTVLPILDYIQIGEDGISYIQPFFDPRPLIEEE